MKKQNYKALLLVLIAALTLEATSFTQYFFSQNVIKEEASLRAEGQLEVARNRILDVTNQTEAAVRNSMWIAQWCLNVPDSLVRVCERIVQDNPVVVGSTVALVPGYLKDKPLLAPYVCRNEDGSLRRLSLATEQYDYPNQEWFTKPIELDGGYWSEPYVDEGGGEILMITYSVPIRDENGKVAAVLTSDISLDWLTEMTSSFKVYPQAAGIILSRSGRIMVSPSPEVIMKNIHDFHTVLKDNEGFDDLNKAMMAGESGNMTVKYQGVACYVYYSPIKHTGWAMAIVIPESDVFEALRQNGIAVKLLQLLGLAMLAFMLVSFIRNQLKYHELEQTRNRIENELQIARAIQMSMVPKVFPPYPNRDDVDVFGQLTPAKEVGGDLFDFYIRDEKLFFCIGDVSGKGIPASLYMVVTKALFRTVSAHEAQPNRILTRLNDVMSQENESNMFVTMFVGVLDLISGRMQYCNAGHDAPLLIGNTGAGMLPVDSNLPIGVMPNWKFTRQETQIDPDTVIFLYTDGLNEAENINHEQFEMQRVIDMARKLQQERKFKPTVIVEQMTNAVRSFVADAEQSDDLTMLAIQYTKHQEDLTYQRSLTLTNDLKRIPRLNTFVEEACEANGFDMAVTTQINLAMEEAVVNVMNYAYPKDSTGNITIEAKADKSTLSFVISDTGTPFDPTAKPEVDITLSAEDRSIGGLGIHLIRQIMDHINYERVDGHNVLTLIKKLA